MKLITFFTDTHKKLMEDFFIPSIKIEDNFEIIKCKGIQHSIDGIYRSPGFGQSMKDKIICLYDNLKQVSNNEVILYSDVDIIFLNLIKEYLKKYEKYDMVFQTSVIPFNHNEFSRTKKSDSIEICAGFFLLRNNTLVKVLLEKIIETCDLYQISDQIALNEIINDFNINYAIFDHKIASPATINGPQLWDGENFEIPNDILVFHANWCIGIENKIKLLTHVKNNYMLTKK